MNHWLELSASALTHNFHALGRAAGCEVLAVIKADGYGHGAEWCAPVLAAAGAHWLGVTCAEEGARVRHALGAAAPDILVMSGFLPDEVAAIVKHGLTPVVWTAEQVDWLGGAPGLPVHVEIDTGMGRQGVEPGAPLAALLERMAAAGLVLDGVFTHFASSEVAGSELTRRQQERFRVAVAQVVAAGWRPAWVHAGNTSTVDNPADPAWLAAVAASAGARAMVRSGLGLYGYCLEIEGGGASVVRLALKPVLAWRARILAVRELAAGQTVGYNATWTAPGPTRVALVPVGYADGLRRELSSTDRRVGGWMMLAGQRAPILGRVSMNLTVVEVSHLPSAAAYQAITVLGTGIDADQHARLAGTIPYDILCGLKSVRRTC